MTLGEKFGNDDAAIARYLKSGEEPRAPQLVEMPPHEGDFANEDYTAEDYARDSQAQLDAETAEEAMSERVTDQTCGYCKAEHANGSISPGFPMICDDCIREADQWYEDYSTYRGMVGL